MIVFQLKFIKFKPKLKFIKFELHNYGNWRTEAYWVHSIYEYIFSISGKICVISISGKIFLNSEKK